MSTTEFLDLCNDPWAEPMTVGLNIMVPSGVGGTNLILDLLEHQEIVSASLISSKREKKHGVMQGQAWQIKCTNIGKQYTNTDYSDAIGQIVRGFRTAGEWEAIATGRVYKVVPSTDGTITFEIHDTVIELLNYLIPRDINYQATGWLGEMQTYSKEPGSKSWDSNIDLVNNFPADLSDETFTVTFTNATDYEVTRDGAPGIQSGSIGSDFNVDNTENNGVVTIPADGWSTDPSAYVPGDVFVFFTARPRTAAELSPVQMVIDLIKEAVPYISVISESPIVSDAFDNWANWAAEAVATVGDEIGGFWAKDTQVSRMIQDALKIVHGAIYSMPSGQLALWRLTPNTSTRVALNGDPENGVVHIINATTTIDLTGVINSVTYEYLDLDGNDASITSPNPAATSPAGRPEPPVRIGWRVRGLSIESAANIHFNRFKNPLRLYQIKTTLAGMLADVGGGVSVTEPDLDLTVEASDVTEVRIDIMRNTAVLNAHVDPVSTKKYAKVGRSKVGGIEVVW